MRCWALAMLMACGGGSSAPTLEDSAQSGARLKLRWLVAGDERAIAVEPNALWAFDTQLGVECTPLAWSDGTTYCTPGTVRGVHTGVVFTDAACSQPMTVVDLNVCPAPVYAEMSDATGLTALWTIGPKSAATTYYDRADTSCIGPLQASGLIMKELHDLGTPIDRSALVAMSLGEPRGTGRVGWRYFDTADGLSQPATLYDTELGTFCSVGLPYAANATNEVACRPTTYPTGDPMTWAALVRQPSSAARLSPTQLASDDTLVHEGDLFDRDSGGPCVPRTMSDGTLRCTSNDATGPLHLYQDSQCQVPIDLVPVAAGTTVPSLVMTGAPGPGCSGTVAGVNAVGAQYASYPYEKSGTVCVPFQRSQGEMSASYTFYVIGEALSFDALGTPIELRVE